MGNDQILPSTGAQIYDRVQINYTWLAEKLGFDLTYSDGELSAPCPLHSDRSPSFSLNLDTGLWCCYARCGGGKFIDLVMRMKGMTWVDAKRWIVQENRPPNPEELQNLLLKTLETPIQDTSSEVYYETLERNTLPRWYFNRQLTWATADRWGVRWDPTRQRIIIPVRDTNGKWVGYVARNLNPLLPKYLNSPRLKASQLLFGWNLTRNRTAILTEGPLDALWLDQNGIQGAAALLGTNLTVEHIHILQMTGVTELVLAMDNDEAGKLALYGHTDDSGRFHHGHLSKLILNGWHPDRVRLVDSYGSAKDFGEVPASDLLNILQAARPIHEEERKNLYVWNK